MMKRTICILLLMTSLVFSQDFFSSLVSTIQAPVFGSTRSFSMGGVFSATNRGIEGLTGNPAGLVLDGNSQFTFSGRWRVLGDEGYGTDYYQDYGYSEYSNEFKPGFKVVNAGVTLPIAFKNGQVGIVGAIGYKSYYDINKKKEVCFSRKSMEGDYTQDITQTGVLDVLSFGTGIKVGKQLRLGAIFNLPIFSGYKYELKHKIPITDGDQIIAYDEARSFDVSGNGIFHFGAQYDITQDLMIGGTFTFSHNFELVNGEFTRERQPSQYGGHKENGEFVDLEFEIPIFWSLGASYRLLPDFILAADMQNRSWENVKIENYQLDNLTKNGLTWRLGAEYGENIKVRAGYFIDRLPMLDKNNDPVDMTGLTGGFGIVSDHINVDIGVNYRRTAYKPSSYGNIIDNEYKINDLLVFATLTYDFDFVIGGN